MTKRKQYAMLLFAACVLGPHLNAQDHPGEKFSKVSVAASEARTKKIHQEVRRLKDHEWAGDYYFGDGLGVNISLALAPEAGFVFSWHGCLGLYDLNYGDVAFTNGTIKLQFKYPNRREGFEGLAPELLPVRWGDRHYLIDVDRILGFTNAINAGTEPSSLFGGRSGSFLLRRGDENKAVTGQPSLPDKFLSYILAEPINTTISSVERPSVEGARRITYVTLDVGTANGLKQGMELYVRNPGRVLDSVLVTSVSEHSARAEIEQMELTDPVPASGWKLSTKF